MKKYLFGFLLHLFNFRISKLAFIDNISVISKKAKIYMGCQIFKSTIGPYTYVAPKSSIVHANIGAFCSIAQNVKIGLGNHNKKAISTSPIFSSKTNALSISWIIQGSFEEFETVNIGNDVWIGMGAMIMGGITIGHGAIIGAGSIVTKDIPNYAIAAGVPAKILKYRFNEKQIEFLLKIKWWNWQIDIIKKNIDLFENVEFDQNRLELIFVNINKDLDKYE
jgi:acetyltransferase-like isoleucine patch superfamily enzyme